jgi:hypothetical protein
LIPRTGEARITTTATSSVGEMSVDANAVVGVDIDHEVIARKAPC